MDLYTKHGLVAVSDSLTSDTTSSRIRLVLRGYKAFVPRALGRTSPRNRGSWWGGPETGAKVWDVEARAVLLVELRNSLRMSY
jgi:hypothetical protein